MVSAQRDNVTNTTAGCVVFINMHFHYFILNFITKLKLSRLEILSFKQDTGLRKKKKDLSGEQAVILTLSLKLQSAGTSDRDIIHPITSSAAQ